MPSILLRLPELEHQPGERPRHCPYCGEQILQSWGQVSKSIRDAQALQAGVYRYRCNDCKRTFRYYPEGVDRAIHTLRVRHLAGLACTLGMSCRDVVGVFEELGIQLSRMAVWRDAQELAKWMKAKGNPHYLQRYLIDRRYIPGTSRKLGVILAIEAGSGKSVILGILDEYNPLAVKSWLEPLVKDFDIEVSLLSTGQLDRFKVCNPASSYLPKEKRIPSLEP